MSSSEVDGRIDEVVAAILAEQTREARRNRNVVNLQHVEIDGRIDTSMANR